MLRSALIFTFRHWAAHKWLVGALALSISLATVTEARAPVRGALVDALAHGPSAVHEAISALIVMASLGLAMIVLRHLGWWCVSR